MIKKSYNLLNLLHASYFLRTESGPCGPVTTQEQLNGINMQIRAKYYCLHSHSEITFPKPNITSFIEKRPFFTQDLH